jgi:hypothetical protein
MVPVRIAHRVDRLSWSVAAVGLAAGLAAGALTTRPARTDGAAICIQTMTPRNVETPPEVRVLGKALPGKAREAKLVTRLAEPMTRIESMPLLDYVSVVSPSIAGPSPWGEATVATGRQAGDGSCDKVMLYARTADGWWSLHLADSGQCATPSAGQDETSDVTTEVIAHGPTFLANVARDATLSVELETRFSSGGHTSNWHTTTHCQVEASGVPTCTHAVVE